MKYIILLRKINVGKDNRISKQALKEAFEALAYEDVEIYINSGNVLFSSSKEKAELRQEIDPMLEALFAASIDFLIKTQAEMLEIAQAIPENWENNSEQKTDVAYLFEEIDDERISAKVPAKKEYLDLRYLKGALIFHVSRENQMKSQYSKIVSSPIYKHMTLRNVNTARYLAGLGLKKDKT